MPEGMFQWIDGKNVDNSKGDSFGNRGFRYGDGLFETILIRNGKALFIDKHEKRLRQGMDWLSMDQPAILQAQNLESYCRDLLQTAEFPVHARIRIQIYRGGGGTFGPESIPSPSHCFATLQTLTSDPFEEWEPIHLCLYHELGLPPAPLSSYKTTNSLPYIKASIFAREFGFDAAIMFIGKQIVEASHANIFWLSEGILHTPDLKSGGLPGITREAILEIAHDHRIEIREEEFVMEDLWEAEEVFLTNSIRGVQPVAQIEAHEFPLSRNGITGKLKHLLDIHTR